MLPISERVSPRRLRYEVELADDIQRTLRFATSHEQSVARHASRISLAPWGKVKKETAPCGPRVVVG